MTTLGWILRFWKSMVVAAMEFFNCVLPFLWDCIRLLISLVIVQTWLPSRQPCLLTGWIHYPVIICGAVHLLAFPRFKTDCYGLFIFFKQCPKTSSENYHLARNNISVDLEKLFECRSVLQPTCGIVCLAVYPKQITRCFVHAAILR